VRAYANKFLATAIVLLITALALRCVWQIIRPLVPELLVIALAAVIVKWLRHREQRW
jgi:hypothetical protein